MTGEAVRREGDVHARSKMKMGTAHTIRAHMLTCITCTGEKCACDFTQIRKHADIVCLQADRQEYRVEYIDVRRKLRPCMRA